MDKTRTPGSRADAHAPLAGGKVRSDNLRPARVNPDRPFPTARGILSAAEIEALLRPDLPAEPARPEPRSQPRTVPDLDGPATTALSLEDAERLCARLTLAMHRATGLGMAFNLLEAATQRFRSAFPPPETGAAFACFGAPGGEVEAVLALSPMASLALIEMSCGADAKALRELRARPLTEIDMALLKRALVPLASLLPGGELVCLERRQAFCLSIAPPGLATCLKLDAKLEGATASARLILSEAAASRLPAAGGAMAEPAGARKSLRPDGLTALLTARIASLSVPVSRLADLKPGDTLLLGVPADEPVQLLSGGRTGSIAAEGEMGRKGNRIAVRVRRLGSALR